MVKDVRAQQNSESSLEEIRDQATDSPAAVKRSLFRPRVSRILTWALAFLVLAFACTYPSFRHPDSFPKPMLFVLITVAIALFVVGWCTGQTPGRSSLWLALALVGQVVSLQLIEAGPLDRYQHFEPSTVLLSAPNVPLLMFLAVQTSLVFIGVKRRLPIIRSWIGDNFRAWQVLGFGLICFLASAAVQRDVPFYFEDLFFSTVVQIVNLGNIVLVVWALPEDFLVRLRKSIERWIGPASHDLTRATVGIDRFALVVGGWVSLLAAVLSVVVYQQHPHITDEVAYLYHARFLADGALTLPAPPVPQAFEFYLMEVKGSTWYASTPPGWPAILAVGVLLGLPGLVNPVLAGINILLSYILLQDLYDRRSARIALLLLAISPWYVFMGMNFMTHTSTLTCALLAAVAVIQSRRTGRAYWGAIAGAAVGIGSLIRPLDGLIAGVLIGLWAIGVGGRRLHFRSLLTFVVVGAVVGALVLPYNFALTGHPTVFPLNDYLDSHFGPGRNDLGFGPNRGYGWPTQPFPGHSPLGATINANLNTFSIDIEMFGWSIGSLLFVALYLLTRKPKKSDYLMIAVCLAVFCPYFFYYFSGGPDFGARYWFMMILPLVALTVQGIKALIDKLESGSLGSPMNGTRVIAAVLVLSLFTLVNYFPWRATDKYYHFWGMRPDVPALAAQFHFGRSLVLVRGTESHPDYTSAAIYNPLDWRADAPVYAWDQNSTIRAQLVKAFPDRSIWIVDGPSLTHGAYKVVAGPLPAGTVPSIPDATAKSQN